MKKEVIKTSTLFRSMTLDRASAQADDRTVSVAFSSEAPVKRWFGIEVLDHGQGACDLSRLNSGGALLDNHDPDKQIGVVVPGSASIGADRIGRATIKFSRSQAGEDKFQDVVDGILTNVSVGYQIKQMVETTTTDGDGEEDTVCRVMSWLPLEISLVAIPADPTVGVGRSAGAEEVETVFERAEKPTPPASEPTPPATTPAPTVPAQPRQEERKKVMEENQGQKDELKRATEMLALADTYEKYGAREMVGDFIRNQKSVADFQAAIMTKITARHSDARDIEIGMDKKEIQSYSLQRAVQAAISKDWSGAGLERSASEEVAKRTGMTPEGFFVPAEAFRRMMPAQYQRAFDVATAANAGNLVQTSVLGGEFVDVLRNALVLNKMGIRVLGGLTSNIAIPRKTVASTISSIAETTAYTDTNPTTTQISLSPKRLGASVPYSKQAIIQSSLDVEAMLRDDLAMGIAVQIDNLGLNGTGTAPQPRGLVNQSGIGAVVGGTNGAQLAWSHVVGLESACANVNAEPGSNAGYVINTKTRGWAKTQPKVGTTFPNFLWDFDGKEGQINGYSVGVTNNMISNGTKGTSSGVCSTVAFSSDWSLFVLALFGGLDIVVDPYTLANAGQVRITANQFIDVALRNPAGFSVMTDALTA